MKKVLAKEQTQKKSNDCLCFLTDDLFKTYTIPQKQALLFPYVHFKHLQSTIFTLTSSIYNYSDFLPLISENTFYDKTLLNQVSDEEVLYRLLFRTTNPEYTELLKDYFSQYLAHHPNPDLYIKDYIVNHLQPYVCNDPQFLDYKAECVNFINDVGENMTLLDYGIHLWFCIPKEKRQDLINHFNPSEFSRLCTDPLYRYIYIPLFFDIESIQGSNQDNLLRDTPNEIIDTLYFE